MRIVSMEFTECMLFFLLFSFCMCYWRSVYEEVNHGSLNLEVLTRHGVIKIK